MKHIIFDKWFWIVIVSILIACSLAWTKVDEMVRECKTAQYRLGCIEPNYGIVEHDPNYFLLEKMPRYNIAWISRITGQTRRGSTGFLYNTAHLWERHLDKKYPNIEHYLIREDVALKKLEITTCIGIDFDSYEAYRDWWKTLPYGVTLTCGCSREWAGIQNVPYENVMCEHDNYFVRVQERTATK